MSRLRPSDLPLVTIDMRRAGELLATPCGCGRDGCTLGEHVLRSTQAMAPGPKAASLDAGGGGRWEQDDDGTVWAVPAGDPTGEAAIAPGAPDAWAELQAALTDGQRAGQRIADIITAHRPDREHPAVEDPTDWCRHHLTTLGACEPRFRGDLCRGCYEFQLAYGCVPPRQLLELRREGRRWTEQVIASALRAERLARRKGKGKRRRAS